MRKREGERDKEGGRARKTERTESNQKRGKREREIETKRKGTNLSPLVEEILSSGELSSYNSGNNDTNNRNNQERSIKIF